jgi:hypothetical protein
MSIKAGLTFASELRGAPPFYSDLECRLPPGTATTLQSLRKGEAEDSARHSVHQESSP